MAGILIIDFAALENASLVCGHLMATTAPPGPVACAVLLLEAHQKRQKHVAAIVGSACLIQKNTWWKVPHKVKDSLTACYAEAKDRLKRSHHALAGNTKTFLFVDEAQLLFPKAKAADSLWEAMKRLNGSRRGPSHSLCIIIAVMYSEIPGGMRYSASGANAEGNTESPTAKRPKTTGEVRDETCKRGSRNRVQSA